MAKNCKKADFVMECSWEVANKVGGIYTVLSTKSQVLQELYKDRFVMIGPDVWSKENPSPYFKEYKSLLKSAQSKLKLPQGIKIRVGRWMIEGKPLTILVDYKSIIPKLNDFYASMWEHFGVDSLHAYGDYGESCAFAIASAYVMDSLVKYLKLEDKHVVAHFDEWTTGMGLLELKLLNPDIATVFTTHATSIGRSICGNGKPLYDYFKGYHGDQMARELNMEAKHSLEKTAAHRADCFTTVSEVTARECTQLLGKTPDVITPNGFNPDMVGSATHLQQLRKKSRSRLEAIASALTGREIDDEKTLILATSGRNEYRNKGIDLFIDSLLELRRNYNLHGKEVLAYIMVPAWVNTPQQGLIDRLEGRQANIDCTFMTHTVHNFDSDAIASRLRQVAPELLSDTRLTIIYMPCYLDGHDGVLNISYYDMLSGLDITVFPSYYEPWGYTPLESVAFGVPTVTTDKSGFGQWVAEHIGVGLDKSGVDVVERGDSGYETSAQDIARIISDFAGASRESTTQISQAAMLTASKADWHLFIKNYNDAYCIAMNNNKKNTNN